MTTAWPLSELLDAAVRVERTRVGTVVGAVLDRGAERLLGLEVVAPDGKTLFLPWVGATARGRVVEADSPLVLIELSGIETYAHLGATILRHPLELEGLAVEDDGTVLRRFRLPRAASGA